MATAQAAENYGDECGLTWYLWWGISTSTPNWTHSQNSLAPVEALSLKISSHGTPDFQYGFRSFKSIVDLLTTVSDTIARAFKRPGANWAVALGIF